MLTPSTLTTAQVLEVFTEEVAAHEGRISDTFHDGERLFTRSVLPHFENVRPGDRVQGGVALKATGDGVWLSPYLFCLVCQNGAIIVEAPAARSLGDLHEQEPETALECVREGIAACCAPEVFLDSVRKMRIACEIPADLDLLPLHSWLSMPASAELLSQIRHRFFRKRDRSQFGLANAVTAVARDTEDPELRWNLEEFGGGIAVGTITFHPADAGRSAMARLDGEVAVG